MNSKILDYINKCEKWKVEIKENHWAANSLSQHELCDDIASSISDFEDLVSEVEQSISGKFKNGDLKPDKAEKIELKAFVEEVISSSQDFLKDLEGMGENYIGIKSECESFIGDMQRKLYLVNFTLKEELKERLKAKINESMPKNLSRHDEVDKFMGRKPKSIKARINQIYRIVKKYGIDSKVYHDENWQAISDYYRAISSLGCEVEMKPCGHISNIDSMQSDGGYCDYAEDGMPRSKQYAIKIMFEDGMNIDGYIKCMAAGTVEDPFSRYDTCIVLWPKSNRMIEDKEKNMKGQIKLTEQELKQVVKEAAMKVINEWGFPDEGFGDDYNTPYGDIDDPRSDYPIGKEGDVEYSWDEDAYLHDETPLRMQNRHDNMNSLAIRRNKENNWTKGELKNRDRMMGKYINGQADADDVGDAWDDLHYESKKPMKVTESELKQVVKEAAMKVLSETPLNYDIDNFSGRWSKGEPSDEELALADAQSDYLDNPFNPPNSWDDDEWVDGDKDLENEYSWDLHDRMIKKTPMMSPVDRQHDIMDAAANRRDHAAYWTDSDDARGNRLMNKWVNGERSLDDLEDADFSYDPYKYNESKKPMKVTESELKQVVKEAAMNLIKEYYTVRSMHGKRKMKSGNPIKDKEIIDADRNAKMAKAVGKQVEKASKVQEEGSDSGIHIKPENKGKFTATKKATGKSTEELTHSKNPLTRKRAVFAQNAKKWAKK